MWRPVQEEREKEQVLLTIKINEKQYKQRKANPSKKEENRQTTLVLGFPFICGDFAPTVDHRSGDPGRVPP
ncbi:hypothetical protein Y032_0002g787 [Ancylostoma ceylanicum]|uniref:Uncharacterized protein n=1 Tax=Ancylostoma ceylanicum TaxID=53326 RepID=A0A016W0N0_9BILA|nr:hypothetical protein Y032_0002g787 [Ancylostoma ceylanicum]